MNAIIILLVQLLNILWWIVILSVIFSWLYAFNVINSSNQIVNTIGRFLYNVTEPIYRPIRRFIPDLGGIDITPIIVLLVIYFLQNFLIYDIGPALR